MNININDKAPEFTLPDQNGEPVSLKDFRGEWVVLYFYPRADTPGCTIEACEFRDVGSSYATALVIQGSLNWMHRWLNPSDEQAVASVAALFVTILLDGLAETAPAVSGERVRGIGRQADASWYPSSMRPDRRQGRG